MPKKPMDCRAVAARCLAQIHRGASLTEQIPIFEANVTERDRPLFRQLCYGTLRFYPRLMAIVAQLLKKPLKAKDSDVLMLMLLGGYQLTDTRVPAHAAINATVGATKDLKKPWAKALVNAVLRQWQRQPEILLEKLSEASIAAHPEWFYQAILKAWPQQAASIMEQNNLQPPMCLRVNQQFGATSDYLEKLIDAGIKADLCNYSAHGIRLQQPVPVGQLPLFSEGWVSVQDEAAQLAASLLQLQPRQRVLDACCAPGGKTCHILETETQLGEVVALDIDENRLQRVEENLQRLHLNASLLTGDAAQTDQWWDGKSFDRILLDAPCSATGVIRRNPDIKLHRNADDIKNLSELQQKILLAIWPTLRPGGRLLYATCSVLPEENVETIARFCNREKDAEHIPIDADWGIPCDFGRQLLPQAQGHDGFYYALLEKRRLNEA